MKLYIISKDGIPYNNSKSKEDTFVKAYFDEEVARRIAKSFCTAEANAYYRYGQGYHDNQDKSVKERNEMSKKLASEWLKRWDVIEIDI